METEDKNILQEIIKVEGIDENGEKYKHGEYSSSSIHILKFKESLPKAKQISIS